MTRADTERRIARYEQHAARTRQMAEAREAVIEAARRWHHGESVLVVGRLCRLDDAVRALEKLEAEP